MCSTTNIVLVATDRALAWQDRGTKSYFSWLLVAAAWLVLLFAVPATASAGTYLSLGDSLAVGTQHPGDPNDPRDHGYAYQLAAQFKLTLVNMGCGGETTGSMINGGNPHCSSVVPQLTRAVEYLHEHNDVVLVTLSIGANDLLFTHDITTIAANLAYILSQLHQAAKDGVVIVGANYYNSILSYWYKGDKITAENSIGPALLFNTMLSTRYQAAGSPMANVYDAFSGGDLTMAKSKEFGMLPINVKRICEWTWACLEANFHPNDKGYDVITRAFKAVLPFD